MVLHSQRCHTVTHELVNIRPVPRVVALDPCKLKPPQSVPEGGVGLGSHGSYRPLTDTWSSAVCAW